MLNSWLINLKVTRADSAGYTHLEVVSTQKLFEAIRLDANTSRSGCGRRRRRLRNALRMLNHLQAVKTRSRGRGEGEEGGLRQEAWKGAGAALECDRRK